ncbi:MAG: ribbon-helix-helix protein, CopG family, partial [Acidimicrobiales bacterium]
SLSIMRTTIAVDDNVLAAAKRRARERGVSLGAVIEDALRAALARGPDADRPAIPVFRGGTGVRPGIDVTSNRALLEALDADRPLDDLR